MAIAENITPRRVLQDLGYAPRLNAPEPIMQPNPQAPLPARDTETTQLVNALGEVNKQIAAYSDIYTNQREQADMQDAAANSIKLLNEARMNQTKTGQAIQSYIDANSANYGSSPKVRKYLYTMIGERQASEDYTKLLDENRSRVANNLKPENADDIIAETRQKFLAKLGDNMFSRAGAESVMNQADNSFRNYAQAQQDQFIKEQTIANINIKIGQIAQEGMTLNNVQLTADNLYKQRDDLKAAGINDADHVWSTSLKNALILQTIGGHSEDVRKVIEVLKSKAITTTDAKGVTTVVGKLGESASMGAFFESLDAAVLKASTDKANEDHASAVARNQAAEDATASVVYDIVGKYNNDPNDPKAVADMQDAIKKISPTSEALARNTETAAKLVANYNNNVGSASPQTIQSLLTAMDNNDFEQVDSIYKTLPITEQNKYHTTIQGFLTSAHTLNSPVISASVEQLKSNLTANLKAISTEPDFSTKFDIINRSLSQYKAQIAKEIKDDRANWKGLSQEDVAFRIGDITARVGQQVLQTSVSSYEAFKNSPQGQREASSAKAAPFPKGIKPVSPTKVYKDSEQIDSVNTWINAFNKIKDASNLSFNFTDPKSTALAQQAQESVQNMAASMMPNLVSMSRFGKNLAGEAVTPQMQESATSAYLSLKSAVGYTSQEILTGKTRDGVPIDVEATLATNPNFSYTTKFFANQQEFTKAVNEYAALASQLSTATTDAQKQELQFRLKNTQYYQLTSKLLPRSGVASLDSASIEKFNNNQKTMLPYETMTQNVQQAQVGNQSVEQQFQDAAKGTNSLGIGLSGDALKSAAANQLTNALAQKFNVAPANVASEPQKYLDIFALMAPKERSLIYDAVVNAIKVEYQIGNPVLKLFIPMIKTQQKESAQTNSIVNFFGNYAEQTNNERKFPSNWKEIKAAASEVAAPLKAVTDFYAPDVAKTIKQVAPIAPVVSEMVVPGSSILKNVVRNPAKEAADAAALKKAIKTVGPTAAGVAAEMVAPGSSILKNVIRNPAKETPYGLRPDGTPKGTGYFGMIKLKDGGVTSEYSIGVNIGGKEVTIPSLVPTLTSDEYKTMINDIIPNNKKVPKEIVAKAAKFAQQRINEGKNPFIQQEEKPSKPPVQ